MADVLSKPLHLAVASASDSRSPGPDGPTAPGRRRRGVCTITLS